MNRRGRYVLRAEGGPGVLSWHSGAEGVLAAWGRWERAAERRGVPVGLEVLDTSSGLVVPICWLRALVADDKLRRAGQ